jgi:hypothetical protein
MQQASELCGKSCKRMQFVTCPAFRCVSGTCGTSSVQCVAINWQFSARPSSWELGNSLVAGLGLQTSPACGSPCNLLTSCRILIISGSKCIIRALSIRIPQS